MQVKSGLPGRLHIDTCCLLIPNITLRNVVVTNFNASSTKIATSNMIFMLVKDHKLSERSFVQFFSKNWNTMIMSIVTLRQFLWIQLAVAGSHTRNYFRALNTLLLSNMKKRYSFPSLWCLHKVLTSSTAPCEDYVIHEWLLLNYTEDYVMQYTLSNSRSPRESWLRSFSACFCSSCSKSRFLIMCPAIGSPDIAFTWNRYIVTNTRLESY